MTKILRMNFLILYFIIMTFSKLSKGVKRRNLKRKYRKRRRKGNKKRDKDNRRSRIKSWQISKGSKRKKKLEERWSNFTLTSIKLLMIIISNTKTKISLMMLI